ncbi:hypothetical protein [Streptomyces sp. NPDC052179]|uniref:hypothetical protein n=1 Tax=Streptomyces sp. NPDC052179 TaxID=3155680 RepID=UPI00343E869C
MDVATRNAVFAAAAQATHWTRLNTGLRTEVTHSSYTYTVDVPSGEDPARARITYRAGFGGTEVLNKVATWGQTAGIVETAMGALRAL